MSFGHLLAYGNSDQESFRNLQVRDSFQVMSVPGTIASYYHEATAAFVLSSGVKYVIDPRSPLFQGELGGVRASHLSLADWHGASVAARMGGAEPVQFPPGFYSASVVAEMVSEVVRRQREYAGQAPAIEKKLDRYARLLAEAMNSQGESRSSTVVAEAPCMIMAPYFAVGDKNDPWRGVMNAVWRECLLLKRPSEISPVLCIDGRPDAVDPTHVLADAVRDIPSGLRRIVFFWLTNFDERKVPVGRLRGLWDTVAGRPEDLRLINLYGGFFSICLRFAGLYGFGNGLTYSESRDWPALASTGAAPPRYYIRQLHMFLPPGLAAEVASSDDFFKCPCDACENWRSAGGTIASLPYHDLKKHFALARKWELEMTADLGRNEVAGHLRDAHDRGSAVKAGPVLKGLPSLDYLVRWAEVLEGA